MRFLAVKNLGSLRPVDQTGEDALRKLGQGQLVTIEVRRPRNIKFHRLYWALVTIVWEQLDETRYPTSEDLHAAIKIAAGLRTRIVLPDGTVGFIPGSIAFHQMTEDDFSRFFDRVCNLIARHFLPGVTEAALRNEVSAMIGVPPETLERTGRAPMTTLPPRRKPPRSGIFRAPRRVWKRHEAFVRSHSCVVPHCENTPIEFMHLRSAANSGTGLKPHSAYGVSGCHEHHAEAHQHGHDTFARKYGIDLWALATAFVRASPDVEMRKSLREDGDG